MVTKMKAVAKPSMTASTKVFKIGCLAFSTKKTDTGELRSAGLVTLQYGDKTKKVEFQGTGYSSQRAALESLVTALRMVKKPGMTAELYTTSKYVKINLHDLHNMKARQWKSRIGEPLAYPELWKEVYELIQKKQISLNIHLIDRKDDRLIEPMQRLSAIAKGEVQPIIMEVSRR